MRISEETVINQRKTYYGYFKCIFINRSTHLSMLSYEGYANLMFPRMTHAGHRKLCHRNKTICTTYWLHATFICLLPIYIKLLTSHFHLYAPTDRHTDVIASYKHILSNFSIFVYDVTHNASWVTCVVSASEWNRPCISKTMDARQWAIFAITSPPPRAPSCVATLPRWRLRSSAETRESESLRGLW